MYSFANIISATTTFVTAALDLIDPNTLIGGAVAVLVGGGILFSVLRNLLRIARVGGGGGRRR